MSTDDGHIVSLGAGWVRRRRPDLPPAADHLRHRVGAGRGGHRLRRAAGAGARRPAGRHAGRRRSPTCPHLGVRGVTITTPTATHAAARARGARPRTARRRRQTVRADRVRRPGPGRSRRPGRPGHHAVPEPSLGQRPADAAEADRRRRAGRRAPLHLADRSVPTGEGQLARRHRGRRRRHAARPRATSGRPGAAPVRAGRRPCTPSCGPFRPGAGAEDEIELHLIHAGGVQSTLAAGMASAAPGPRFQVNGNRGGFVIDGFDVQEEQLKAGDSPASLGAGWGVEPESAWGRLYTEQGSAAGAQRARPVGHLLPGGRPGDGR